MTTTITPRSVAVGKFPASVPALLKFTQAFASGLTDNPNFPDSWPIVAAINTAYTTLNAAETAAKARTQGTVAVRNVAKSNLVTALHAGKSYVQGKADANLPHGQAIIESSGLAVRKTTIRQKADMGKTWTTLPSTLQAKTTVPNLPVGTIASSCFRSVTKAGECDWGQIVTLLMK